MADFPSVNRDGWQEWRDCRKRAKSMAKMSNRTRRTRLAAERARPELSNHDDLYFFRVKGGPVKVGRSRDVAARLRTIQSSSPYQVTCLLILPAAGWQEPLWHHALGDSRLRGEWFECYPEIEEAIELARNGLDWWKALWPPSSVMMEQLNPSGEHSEDEIAAIADGWRIDMRVRLSPALAHQ